MTVKELKKQAKLFENSEDQNIEHYRYNTLKKYLDSKGKLSDKDFENFLTLTFGDTDGVMAGAATADMFTKIELTEIQFRVLCQ